MATFVKIASVTVGAGGASAIDFSNISGDFTDLYIKFSLKCTLTPAVNYNWLGMRFNNDSTSTYLGEFLVGNTTTTASQLSYTQFRQFAHSTSSWASGSTNTFSNGEVYISNYSNSANNKNIYATTVAENNNTSGFSIITYNGSYPSGSAVTSISLYDLDSNLVQHSRATLYGIAKK